MKAFSAIAQTALAPKALGMAIYMGAGPSVMYASHAFAALQQFEAEKTVQSA
jgi:homoserine kinase